MPAGDTMEVVCRICGNPVTLEPPSTGDAMMDRMLKRVARNVVHDRCELDRRHHTQMLEAEQMLLKQAERWPLLCPPLYQDSEAWLLTPSSQSCRSLRRDKIKEVVDHDIAIRRHLIAFGAKSGTGKTTALWLLLKRIHKDGGFIVAMTHTEFSRRATMFARDMNMENNRWAKLVLNCDVLLIDDLGKGRFKSSDGTGKAAEEFLFDVVDRRCARNATVLFTSNHNREEIRGLMSEERAEPFTRRLNDFFHKVNFDS